MKTVKDSTGKLLKIGDWVEVLETFGFEPTIGKIVAFDEYSTYDDSPYGPPSQHMRVVLEYGKRFGKLPRQLSKMSDDQTMLSILEQ